MYRNLYENMGPDAIQRHCCYLGLSMCVSSDLIERSAGLSSARRSTPLFMMITWPASENYIDFPPATAGVSGSPIYHIGLLAPATRKKRRQL